ncbi:DUF262 domain-containing protein [Pseudobutyrivibrio sp.]|uniref:DUF262 domain-containing protein n=1 Tax=Pseudobutyrivibrio sp. TaxID=2014367 RepID=UPI00386DD9BA
MATNYIDLKNIHSLSGLNFYIPEYQRGYRWSDGQVIQMLNDFKEFCKRIEDEQVRTGEFYCLQPIVVKKRTWKDKDGDKSITTEGYEVIDGQQRLTTLFIILKSLEQICQILYPEFKFYNIKYDTRLEYDYDSQEFLQNINTKSSNANEFIDFYYMKIVHDAVISWFKTNPDDKLKIARALLEQSKDSNTHIDKAKNIRVIWYEVMDEESATSIDIYTRLNIGKIPLTNAELIKALLLRRGNFVDTDVTMKQLQIATEWNRIEQKLQDDSFWYFLYRTDNPFSYENRIEFIFDLMKNRTKDSEFYHTFNEFNKDLEKLQADKENFRNDQARIDKIWDAIKAVFQTLEEWYEDRVLYHYIGFLIEYKSDIKRLMDASISMNKSKFLEVFIKKEISDKLTGINLDDLSFNDNKGNVKKILLLFNILTVLQDKKSDLRFPFNKYKKEKWDIEHVCSQTDKLITNDNQRRMWIADMFEFFVGSTSKEKIDDFIEDLKEQIEQLEEISDIQEKANLLSRKSELDIIYTIKELSESEDIINDNDFDEAFKKVLSYFKENQITDKDSIANLALLDQETNRSYGNAFFPVKRKRIIQNDKMGIFVPIATKNLFLKYYSRRSTSLMSWQESDAEDYLDNIKLLISPFIKA